ncbi:hypothetical protein L0222_25525 [bacterium]|nr:hypothetical protein [bacterium]MCI0606931.1 hypothetical protein [bacterium]
MPEALQEIEPGSSLAVGNFQRVSRQAKKDSILNALKKSDYNYTEAAKILGVHVTHLHRLIRNLNLKKDLP